MTEITDRPAGRTIAIAPWIPAVAITANVFSVTTVMFWIYHARAEFIALHPDYVAVEPPTISRAISDPVIGEPFHLWVSVSGLLLVFGVFWLAQLYSRLRDLGAAPDRRLARWLRVGVPTLVLFQALSAIGMYLLSGYRFPHFHGMHMIGSYTFFVSQALVVLIGTIVSGALLRDRQTMQHLRDLGLMHPRMVRLRVRFGVFCLCLTVAYVALFKGKNMDFGVANEAVYVAYTSVEPLLITCFLLFLALFQTDLVALRRFQRRS